MMPQEAQEIRRRSHRLKLLSTLIFAALALVLCIEATVAFHAIDSISAVQSALIHRLPVLFYLIAIWMMRNAFAALARGAIFSDMVPALLKWVGLTLSAGAFATVFAVPLLLRVTVKGDAGGFVNFDPAAILLGVVGLMLTILARLLIQAADIKTELEEFF